MKIIFQDRKKQELNELIELIQEKEYDAIALREFLNDLYEIDKLFNKNDEFNKKHYENFGF